MQDHKQKPDTEFSPNLVNTVCFLVQWVVQLTTFAVNYLGHPFNQSLLENTKLALALRWGTLGFIAATVNIVPGTDWALSLVIDTPRPPRSLGNSKLIPLPEALGRNVDSTAGAP